MKYLFLKVLSMSGTAAVVILLVLLARLVLRGAPKKFSYVLWAVVLFRLLCPFSIQSHWSAAPSFQVKPASENLNMVEVNIERSEVIIRVDTSPAVRSESTSIDSTGSAQVQTPDTTAPAHSPAPAAPSLLTVVSVIWLAGVGGLLGYSALSLLRLRRRLVGAVPMPGNKNVFLVDHIPTPFVLGILCPKIFLPSNLSESERPYIILHERTHIRRLDHITRALAWLAVAVHWFNPLVWLAFCLAGKDMEMSCDEAVLRQMGQEIRSDYSTSLLRLSVEGLLPAGPLSFGSGDPERRIKNVLNYKKPARWVLAAAFVAALCTGAALATNRSDTFIDPDSITAVTAFNASSYTITERGNGVYTPDDRKKDLENPNDPQTVSLEDGRDLANLINSYGKTIYGRGELTLDGWEHHYHRFDCTDGSFYLMNYWYWNGFSFNPLHFGEDSYLTLVTHYDASGNPGITWRMEYAFDRAYKDWLRRDVPPVERGELKKSKVSVDGLDTNLTFSMYSLENMVNIEGSIEGVKLQKEQSYWCADPYYWYPEMGFEYPCGWLSLTKWELQSSLEYKTGRFDGSTTRQFGIDAGWTDESRTSIAISTMPRTINNSVTAHGYWHFTVDLSTGTVTSMEAKNSHPYHTPGDPVIMHPESISDEEAVEMARAAAKLIEAAEHFYNSNRETKEEELPADSGLAPLQSVPGAVEKPSDGFSGGADEADNFSAAGIEESPGSDSDSVGSKAAVTLEEALELVFEYLGGYGEYPDARRRTVDFGGYDVSAYYLETVEANGLTWEYCLDCDSPPDGENYLFHLYYVLVEGSLNGGHTATTNWFEVSMDSGVVTPMF